MHRDIATFSDILESAKLALEYVSGITFKDFKKNIIIQDAVIRRIELIGEASIRISKESRTKYKHLPWRQMKGMRNLLIHEYDAIDIEMVWNTVKNNLPELIKQIETIIQ